MMTGMSTTGTVTDTDLRSASSKLSRIANQTNGAMINRPNAGIAFCVTEKNGITTLVVEKGASREAFTLSEGIFRAPGGMTSKNQWIIDAAKNT